MKASSVRKSPKKASTVAVWSWVLYDFAETIFSVSILRVGCHLARRYGRRALDAADGRSSRRRCTRLHLGDEPGHADGTLTGREAGRVLRLLHLRRQVGCRVRSPHHRYHTDGLRRLRLRGVPPSNSLAGRDRKRGSYLAAARPGRVARADCQEVLRRVVAGDIVLTMGSPHEGSLSRYRRMERGVLDSGVTLQSRRY